MGAARRGVKISCDQRGNIEGTEWNLIFSTLHCTPRRVAIDRNMSTAVHVTKDYRNCRTLQKTLEPINMAKTLDEMVLMRGHKICFD